MYFEFILSNILIYLYTLFSVAFFNDGISDLVLNLRYLQTLLQYFVISSSNFGGDCSVTAIYTPPSFFSLLN